MKLSFALIAAAPAIVSAKRISSDTKLDNADVKAMSKTGNRILSKARRLDGGDNDFTWMAGYSLKFHSCVENQNYYGGYFNNDGNDQGNNNYNGNGQNNGNNYNANGNGQYNDGNYNNGGDGNDFEGMYQQKLVHFKLCPSNSCWRCQNGADYVVELGDYVDAILEAKMTTQEYECEKVRENCYCENAYSEQSCMYNCFKNANLDSCAEDMYEDKFDLQEAVECVQLEADEDALKNYYISHLNSNQQQQAVAYDQNGYYNANGNQNENQAQQGLDKIYVGPYCAANGKNIHLGVFMEETCSYPAPKGIYEALNYGETLPYSKKGLVDSGCVSCKAPVEVNYENYYEQQQEVEVTGVCSQLYEEAGKCEEGLDGYFPYRDNYGCGFIKTLKTPSVVSVGSANMPAKVFAGIFAVTTAALAALSMVLFKRNRRQNVSLAGDSIIS